MQYWAFPLPENPFCRNVPSPSPNLSHKTGCWVAAGGANTAADWFEKLGYELPRGVNQADFFLDIASGDVKSSKLSGEEARLHCISCSEKFLATHPRGFLHGANLSEAELGRELWYAAEVNVLTVKFLSEKVPKITFPWISYLEFLHVIRLSVGSHEIILRG